MSWTQHSSRKHRQRWLSPLSHSCSVSKYHPKKSLQCPSFQEKNKTTCMRLLVIHRAPLGRATTTLPSTHPEAPGQRRGPAFPSQVYLPKWALKHVTRENSVLASGRASSLCLIWIAIYVGFILTVSCHLCLVPIIGNHDTFIPPDIFSWSQWKLLFLRWTHPSVIKTKGLKSHSQNRNLGGQSKQWIQRVLKGFSILRSCLIIGDKI